VSGVKKWITGGMYADFFTTLVNIEGEGCPALPQAGGVLGTARAVETPAAARSAKQ
jgi:alkylation response protein AidB-like acyl-CoA dehydrogenase